MNPDPAPASWLSSDDGDVDRTGIGWVGEQLQEVRGAEVTHNRAGAAGEECRHLTGALHHHGVADQIEAAVHRMKATGPDTPLDRAALDARRQELRATDHAPLPPGDRGDHPIG
jgi:hypothetical protein